MKPACLRFLVSGWTTESMRWPPTSFPTPLRDASGRVCARAGYEDTKAALFGVRRVRVGFGSCDVDGGVEAGSEWVRPRGFMVIHTKKASKGL